MEFKLGYSRSTVEFKDRHPTSATVGQLSFSYYDTYLVSILIEALVTLWSRWWLLKDWNSNEVTYDYTIKVLVRLEQIGKRSRRALGSIW